MATDVSLGGPPCPATITFPPSLDNSTSVRIALQQPLFTGKRIAGSIRQAEALRDSSRGDLGRSRLDLRYSITEAFWNLARAKTQRAAIDQSVAQAEAHLADARKLLDQGMATNNDVLQAQMRLEDARIELAGARACVEIARDPPGTPHRAALGRCPRRSRCIPPKASSLHRKAWGSWWPAL